MELRHALGRDLRFGLRHLRQAPIVTGVALVSLALGIGANVAIFSLVNALILKPLPVQDPGQLVVLGREDARNPGGGPSTSFTYPQFESLRSQGDVLQQAMAVSFARFNLNAAGEARIVPGLYVSGGFLDGLGVSPSSAAPSPKTTTAARSRRRGRDHLARVLAARIPEAPPRCWGRP